jgi:transcriptional regulator with XRE-family HTH domain
MNTALPSDRRTPRSGGAAKAAPTDFPGLIRELRARTGLTQEQFAAKLGVTFPTINRWENGRTRPSPLALQQVRNLVRELAGDAGPLAARQESVLRQ